MRDSGEGSGLWSHSPHFMIWGSQASHQAFHRLKHHYFLLSGPRKGEDIPPVLIKPVCNPFCFWSERLKTLFWCGVRHDSPEVSTWTHLWHRSRGCYVNRSVQTSFQQLLFEVMQGMLRRHRRLEMKSAEPSCQDWVRNRWPIPCLRSTRGRKVFRDKQPSGQPAAREIGADLPLPEDKTTLYTPERSSWSYCLLPPSKQRKTLELTCPQSSPSNATSRPSRAASLQSFSSPPLAHHAELQLPTPGLLLPTSSSSSTETGPASPQVSQLVNKP